MIFRSTFVSDRESEKDSCIDWGLVIADDQTRRAQLSKHTLNRVVLGTGLIYIGIISSKYAHDMTLSLLKKGARMMMKYDYNLSTSSKEGKDDFQQWYETGSSFDVFGNLSICLIVPEKLNAKDLALQVIGESGSKVKEWQDQYNFDLYHERTMAKSTYDYFATTGITLQTCFPRFGDVEFKQKFDRKWQPIDIQAHDVGTSFRDGSLAIWPGLSAAMVEGVCHVRSLSFANASSCLDALPPVGWSWSRTREDGKVACRQSPSLVLLNVRAIMMANMPHTIQKAAATEILPSPDCMDFCDLLFETQQMWTPPSVMLCPVAVHLVDHHLAAQYARAALQFHKNPVKLLYAHNALGALMMIDDSAESAGACLVISW